MSGSTRGGPAPGHDRVPGPGHLLARLDGPLASALYAAVILLFVIGMLLATFVARSTPSQVDSAACGRALTVDSGQLTGQVRVAPEPQSPLVESQHSGVSAYDGNGVTMSALPGTAIRSPIPGRVVQTGPAMGKPYKNSVVIDSTGIVDESVVLGNMDTSAISVHVGETVQAGQLVGAVGAADGTAGLWLEAWAGGNESTGGHDIDPRSWLRRELSEATDSTTNPEGCTSDGLTIIGNGAVATTLRAGQEMLGIPYSWGGGSLTGPSYGADDANDPNGSGAQINGFDCSSLVRYMIYAGSDHRIVLPRTAQEQYTATRAHEVSLRGLRPGDLLFWGKDGSIYHVAMYVGAGNIIAAPTTGQDVKIEPIWGQPSHATRLRLD